MLIAQRARGFQQRQRIQIKHRQGLRMVARLHAIARQAQQVADSHGGTAQDVALDGDAVLVPAGDLHHRCVAHPGEERAHGETRHVAVGATAVGGVDGVHLAVENAGAPVDVLRIGRVGRRELAGDRELSGAQYPLEASR